MLPDVDERGLVVDTELNDEVLDVWLTESEPGGCGIITRMEDVFHQDPVSVLNLFMRSFAVSDYEQIDYNLFGDAFAALIFQRTSGGLECDTSGQQSSGSVAGLTPTSERC